MEQIIELFLGEFSDENRPDAKVLIENTILNISCAYKYTTFKNFKIDIVIIDTLIGCFYGSMKTKKKIIKIFINDVDRHSLEACRKKGFVKEFRSLYDMFYMRSLNMTIIDDVFPDWKKIRVCDILEETGVNCIDFKSDYDLEFTYQSL